MDKKRFTCPACGLGVYSSDEELEGFPSKRLDLCRPCKFYDKLIPILGVLFFLSAITVIFLGMSLKQTLGLSGLSLDVSGVSLLFGKMERPVIVSGLLRGEGKDPLEVALPRHVWQTRTGLLLVTIGFVLQALSLLV
ncbi:MAG: hypothetical protein HYT75_06385 [Deltaproteobacteria bacterium]|nr:hypothetical protein [Deltaproteobacteria bacterium]